MPGVSPNPGTAIQGPVKIALVDVLSGPSAAIGTNEQNALQVEIDDINARGGLLGHQLQLVTADDQLKLDATPGVVKQMLADRSVRLMVGPSFAGLYLGAKPLIEQARVPNCLTSMAADDVMANAPFSFRAQAADHARVPAVLAYIRNTTPLRKVGLVAADDSVGHGSDALLSDQAGHYGLQYVGAAFAGAGDQKPLVQQMVQRGAEALVLSDDPALAQKTLLAVKQANAGAKLKAFGTSGLSTYDFAQQVGDPANGLVFSSSILTYMSDVPEARWPATYRDFVSRVVARYGRAQNGVEMRGSAAAAACLLDWSRAVQAVGDFDGVRVAKAWEALDVPAAQSVLGVHEQFGRGNHDAVPADALFVYQRIKNGDRWSLKQLTGAP
jgi:branched-chain amino acid transport system substrate-binding protein